MINLYSIPKAITKDLNKIHMQSMKYMLLPHIFYLYVRDNMVSEKIDKIINAEINNLVLTNKS